MTRRKQKAIVRELPESDPRNLAHPSNREQLLEFARAIGRMEAREHFLRVKQAKAEKESDD
jgi:hypothetical protein